MIVCGEWREQQARRTLLSLHYLYRPRVDRVPPPHSSVAVESVVIWRWSLWWSGAGVRGDIVLTAWHSVYVCSGARPVVIGSWVGYDNIVLTEWHSAVVYSSALEPDAVVIGSGVCGDLVP